MAASNHVTDIYIRGHDLASSAFFKVSKNVNVVTGQLNQASRKLQRFGRNVTANAMVPMTVATGASMTSAYNFSEAINQVAATAQLSEKAMEPYTKTIREFGRTTQFTAVDAAKGFNYLLQAGSTLDEAVALLPETLNLAAAGSMSLAKAADYSTNAFAGFGMASKDVQEMRSNMEHLNDVVAFTATKANTNVPQMFMAMKEAGPVSNALGISLEKTAAILGVFGNNGFQGAAAGRSFRTGMLRLIAPAKKARKAFAALGVDTNKYFNETNRITGSKLTKALSSQGIKVNSGILQDILENSTSEDLLGELVEKVVNQVGDKSVEAREKISQTISDSFAANAKGLDIFALLKDLQSKGASAADLEAIFGKMQVAKFMSLINSEAAKGHEVLHRSIMKGAEGAAKQMSETQMRGMVGGLKRFESVVEGLNLSLWDSGLADDMTNSLAALTGFISGLNDSDIDLIYNLGIGLGGLVLSGTAIVSIAKLGTSLVTVASGLSKAAAGAALFAPYVVVGSALLLGIGYLVSAYEKEGKASEYAAKAERDHADQLERVNRILGEANANSLKYGENLDNATKHDLKKDVIDLEETIDDQKLELVGNLQTDGWGASSLIEALPDDIKAEIDEARKSFKLGSVSHKEFSDNLISIASKSKEATIALDTAIKNARGAGFTIAAKAQKEALLEEGNLTKGQAKRKVDRSLTTVSFLDNDEYLTITGQIKEQEKAIAKLANVPVSKGIAHFNSYQDPNAIPMMFNNAQQKTDRINTENAELTEMKRKLEGIKMSIDIQNRERRMPATLEGQAYVDVRVKVDGADVKSSSVSTSSSGHIKAQANLGQSMPELTNGTL